MCVCRVRYELYSPPGVELHVRVEQSDDGRGGGPPPADSGPDQSFLLVMADHLDEARAVLSVGLVHEALQVFFQLHWTESDTNKHRRMFEADSLKPVDLLDKALLKLPQLHRV